MLSPPAGKGWLIALKLSVRLGPAPTRQDEQALPISNQVTTSEFDSLASLGFVSSHRNSVPYYALTIFLSAFLLFLVQPLIGKLILPWFGGTPAVWTTCMLFFQVLLLLGYAYAHSIVNRSPRFQRRIHLAVLLLSVLLLICLTAAWKTPILPGESWKPRNSDYPTWKVVQLLAVSVGFPFWILSATGPLLQSWFSRTHSGASPYRLYALSNLGSLLALISYPFLVEPTFTLGTQGAVWSLGYLIFVLCCALSSFQAMRSPTVPSDPSDEFKLRGNGTESLTSIRERESQRPSWGQNLLWLSLAACASIMLLATTNQICQEVAVIPFLWILPLCLYLLSFILCFESDLWYSRRIFLLILPLAVILACGVLYKGIYAKLLPQILIYSFVLFTCCMICHGELVRLKPCSRYLTSFYLLVATGGALGGIFIGLAAPRIFKGYWEFHFGLWLACCVTLVVQLYDKSSWVYERHPWPSLLLLFTLILFAKTLVDGDFSDSLVTALRHALLSWQTGMAALAVATLAAIEQHKKLHLKRLWLSVSALSLALGVLAFVFISHARIFLADSVWVSRNFYGVLVVKEQDPDDPQEHLLRLRHGRITHGLQYQAADKRYLPTSYYGRKSGVGLALLNHPRRFTSAHMESGGLRIGVVGLGVGTLAAYAQAGDSLRYYEINPEVVKLSLGARPYFTYVQHCPAQVDVVLGDARISMERELDQQHPQSFDVLAIDAFNSDSIPVHLLTKEVMSLYLRHLRMPDGIVAIHVSNRYLDLKPVVWGLADHFGLASAYVDTEAEDDGVWGSSWILLARNPGVLLQPEIAIATTPRNSTPTRLWTDDFSNLFQILKK